MEKYGLQRGIRGSDAKHISTPQYYRDLHAQNEELKEDIGYLVEQKEEVHKKIRNLYDRKDKVREKFLDMEFRLNQLQKDHKPYKAQEELNAIHNYFPMMKEQMRTAGLCEQVGLVFDSIRALLSGKNPVRRFR